MWDGYEDFAPLIAETTFFQTLWTSIMAYSLLESDETDLTSVTTTSYNREISFATGGAGPIQNGTEFH